MGNSLRFVVVVTALTAVLLCSASLTPAGRPGPIPEPSPTELIAAGRMVEARTALEQAAARGGEAAGRDLAAFLATTGGPAADFHGEALLLARGEWRLLASRQAAGLSATPTARELGLLATYRRLAGDSSGLALALERLLARAEEQPTEAAVVAAALLLNDRPDLARPVLEASGQVGIAFDMLVGELRLAEAFALAESASSSTSATPAELSSVATKAARLRAVLEGSTPELGTEAERLAAAAAALEALPASGGAGSTLAGLFPGRRNEAEVVWELLRQTAPADAATTTLGRVRTWLDGQAPVAEVEDLLQAAALAATELDPREQPNRYLGLANLAGFHQLDELAVGILEQGARAANAEWAWLALGDRLAGQKDWAAAAKAYARAFDQSKDAAALALEGWALTQGDAPAEGQALLSRAAVLPLGDEGVRYRLATVLEQHDLDDLAREQRLLLLHLGRPTSWAVQATYQRLAQLASCDEDYAAAVRLGELARVHALLAGNALAPASARCLSRLVQGTAARGLARGVVAAGPDPSIVLEPWVVDIDATADLVNAALETGRSAEVQPLFQAVRERLGSGLTAVPGSAHLLNSTAWLLARTHRDLDEAAELATRAASLEPENPAYLDTLAEVRFQQGNQAEALALEQRALALDAPRPFYRAQLERFELGDPTVPVPPAR